MASTTIYLSTLDRVIMYTPSIPPSFLGPICGSVVANPEVEFITDLIDAETDAGITVEICRS